MVDEDAGEHEEPEVERHEGGGAEPPDPIAERDRRIEELTDDLKRLQAEFDNYKKRLSREDQERSRAASEGVVRDLLAVLDTFDSALDAARKGGDHEDLVKGLEGIHRQLLQSLQRNGLREVRTDGGFDPFEHEAVLREERDEGDDGRILEVYQKGYLLGPKVIRTAKVKVSAVKETEECDDQEGSQKER